MNYFYTFIKENEYITVSGNGIDAIDLQDLEWTSSPGALGVLKQMESVDGVYSPTVGFVSASEYKNNIYIQIAKFGGIYKDGWRFGDSNIPTINSNEGDETEK